MEPFAQKPNRRLQLHWWITAGVAIAFFAWNFDLIPRIRSAASGTVAQSKSDERPKNASQDSLNDFEDDWNPDFHDPQEIDTDDSSIASRNRNVSGLENGEPENADEAGSLEPLPEELTEPDSGATDVHHADNRRAIADPSVKTASLELPGSYDSRNGSRPVARAHEHRSELPDESNTPDKPSVSSENRVIPADVAAQLRQIDELFRADQILDAHAELSAIYWKHRELRDLIRPRIDHTAKLIFTTSERQFGPPHFVEYGETLQSIAQQYEVPWEYLAMLNKVTPEKLQAGQELKVVRGPFGAVVDLRDFTLTVDAHGWFVKRYIIGIGRDDKTPPGEYFVQDKLTDPTWYNPDGGIIEPHDPENPLGAYWLGIGNHLGIHGTNDPDSIGKAASRGCIHMADDDIAEVFGLLGTGSRVLIRK